jgi:hypothetical protein
LGKEHWAYLNDEGKKLWGDVFPNGIVPVVVFLPQNATLADSKEVKTVYLIDHKQLTPEQSDLIFTKLSTKFKAPKEAIKVELVQNHLPLRAELTNGSGTNNMGLFI